ncbi:MAG: hypothetical protein ABSH06_28005 [Thermodesulfobacteriota bacterium]
MRVASIDIGTNTILLLIAEVDEGKLKPLFEMETIVGLGKGLQKDGALSQEAESKKSLPSEQVHSERLRTPGIS